MNEDDGPARIEAAEFYGRTTLHPIGLSFLLAMILAVLLLPRKYAIWPAIFIGCFISPAQRIVLFTANFPFMRILLIFALVRVISRQEFSGLRFRDIDRVMIAHALARLTVYTIQQQTMKAFIYQAGTSIDELITYFIFRALVRSFDDFRGMTLGFLVASIPVAIAFAFEYSTRRNVFSILGGVPLITEMREGKLRCRGAFSHTLMAGCYWSAILPLAVAGWFDPRQRKLLTITSAGCCLLIIVTTSSSTPLMGVIFGIVGACLFPLRRQMKAVRWALLITLLLLHFVFLKGPVWSLIAKVNIFGGSTGWHRTHLIDRAVALFGEWWLWGTTDTEHWGWGLHDVTNQFILEGVIGGALTMGLFTTLIVLTFRNLGRILRSRVVTNSRSDTILIWSLGVAVFVHIMNFLAVSYFGQITMLIWLPFAVAASLSDTVTDQDRRDRLSKMSRMTYAATS